MSLGHMYQDFGGFRAAPETPAESNQDAIEDQKLLAFEEGYQAGWDDAMKASEDDKSRISAELEQNLQDMSFTYHEALAKLTNAMKPLMDQIVQKMLPPIAQNVLGPHIVEQLAEMVRECGQHPVEIVASPDAHGPIEALVGEYLKDPFSLLTEPSLGPGQAFVRIGQTEKEIDLDSVVSGISEAVDAFFHQTQQEQNHG